MKKTPPTTAPQPSAKSHPSSKPSPSLKGPPLSKPSPSATTPPAAKGTAPEPTSATTYNFTLRATDQEAQTADRAFSITVTTGIPNGGQFN